MPEPTGIISLFAVLQESHRNHRTVYARQTHKLTVSFEIVETKEQRVMLMMSLHRGFLTSMLEQNQRHPGKE